MSPQVARAVLGWALIFLGMWGALYVAGGGFR